MVPSFFRYVTAMNNWKLSATEQILLNSAVCPAQHLHPSETLYLLTFTVIRMTPFANLIAHQASCKIYFAKCTFYKS